MTSCFTSSTDETAEERYGPCGGKIALLYPPNAPVGLVSASEGSAASCVHDALMSISPGTRSREVLICSNISPVYVVYLVHPRGSATARLLILFASCGGADSVSALFS
jgi:hypothetical protein